MTNSTALGTHDYTPDPRNETILINVNGVLKPRAAGDGQRV